MQLPNNLRRKISILCISTFFCANFCFASVGASDDLLIERATETATRIAKGHKASSELLAKLLVKDVEIIFIMEKKGLKGEEIWKLFHANFHDDLEAFIRGIRSAEKGENNNK